MASIVIAYGIVLAGLGLMLQRAAPPLAKVTLITSLTGGGLCMLWGVVGLTGHKRRAWAILTLVAIGFVVLSQVVHIWSGSAHEAPGRFVGALLVTFMMLLDVAMLIYLVHGERPPEFYTSGTVRRDDAASRGGGAQSERARHRSESR